jgi:hypothetical protein
VVKTRDEQAQIGDVVDRLAQKYSSVPSPTVVDLVREVHGTFAEARIREFIPLFVERRARTALDKLEVTYAQNTPGKA